jgi:hypothetical protein
MTLILKLFKKRRKKTKQKNCKKKIAKAKRN